MTAKPNYTDLIARRATANTRRLYKVPLCLDPSLYADRDTAREAHRDAVAQAAAAKAAGTASRTRLSDTHPVTVTKQTLEAIEQQIRDASLVLVVAGRTSDETVRVIKTVAQLDVPEDAPTGDRAQAEADNTFALNRALFLDAYQWAETLDGERLPEISVEQISSLLPTLSTGEMNTLVMARNLASAAPDFPTLRRS